MSEDLPQLVTIGQLVAMLDVPRHRIEYILRSRAHIRPRAVAGGVRCFDDDAVARIRHELAAIDARRERGAE
jgi:hypothetical protein